MVDRDLILHKLHRLQGYIDELKEAEDITWEVYQKDLRSKRFVERTLHLCLEEMMDISQHIISDEGWETPQTYRDIFRILADHGVIPKEELDLFGRMASFRNILVHHYEKIDDSIVFGIFKKHLPDLEYFRELIMNFLQKTTQGK